MAPEQRQEATVASITLSSADIPSSDAPTPRLPATFTCDGKDSWPEISWEGVPTGTEELALFAVGLKPVNGQLFVNWALSGLDPQSGGIEAGRLPQGAVMGRNSFGQVGYSICPAAGERETYFFTLYALNERLDQSKGFDPHELREQALQVSSDGGLFAVSYGR